MTRILLVDDDPVFRDALATSLTDRGCTVTVASSARDALSRLATGEDVDVVLADIRMPELTGVDLVAHARRSHPDVPVVLLSAWSRDEWLEGAMRAGAAGYVTKDAEPEAIVRACEAAAAGLLTFTARPARSLADAVTSHRHLTEARRSREDFLASVPPRCRDVARLMLDGASNREIARALHLSEGTVRDYVSVVLAHANATSRRELMVRHPAGAGH